MKALKYLLASILFLSFFLLSPLNSLSQERELHKITDSLYIFSGLGGNVGFLVTEEGVLVVDSGTIPDHGKEIATEIEKITDKPIKYLVYTHYHGDHTHGAQSLPSDITTISHINTLKNLEKLDMPRMKEAMTNTIPQQIKELEKKVEKLKAEKSPDLEKAEKELQQTKQQFAEYKKFQLVFPTITFKNKSIIYLGNQKIKLIYLGSGHTNGDVLVYFPEEKVIHMGDLYFENMIPYIDYQAGSNTENWIKILLKVTEMDVEKVIPGHGEITDKNGLIAQAQYLKDLRAEVEKFIKQGATLEETKEKLILPEYKEKGYYDRLIPVNIEAVYKEMTKKKKAQ
jgi:glyoxylase-like metal-dependent hydrolase (beta-lactamase superfamily II)